MISEDLFLLDFTVFVKFYRSLPNTALYIERTSDGWRMAIYQNSMEDLSVDVSIDPSTRALINKLLAYCLVQVGNQQVKPKVTLRPSATDRLSQAGLRRYPRPGGKSTKKT